MEPFANVGELLTFIFLFFVAVAVIPYAFAKMNDVYTKGFGISSGEQKSKSKHMDDIL
tara:strand:- start:8710 stop:8883 length:174 start_codon:yes stop_codon:yes gene_type:complete